ncbi:guanylate kinase [Candidatus Blochmanniella floridana]|uniref:Guanylate kinase n=1 Tax=Blochmanniella floridana TaxID=203907 RepID=KGUA_BLOFL|nr:RecName: Full=Guanylate kinase; AltName: Full=GMP kinase [Candidatus Blochmannia floridanus]CAD83291.1 guanylate kinase [Candidatus Blochmannia floridanus]
MKKYSGLLGIISAPSGAGKSTLINALQKNDSILQIKLSISYTTRKKRPGEVHGKDYYFISIEEFQNMINQNMFLEYAKVFNHYYGTEKNSIKLMLNSGVHVILNIDWQGMNQIRNKKLDFYTIFILPPSQKELEKRLRFRGLDTDQVIFDRMKQAMNEISHCKEYDYIIINDDFNIALIYLQSVILSKQLKIDYQEYHNSNLINNLLSCL